MAVVKKKPDPMTPAKRREAEKKGHHWKGWLCVWYVPDGTGGTKQREKSFATKDEADGYALQMKLDARLGVFPERDHRTTLADYGGRWIEDHPGRPRTRKAYEGIWRNHVAPTRLGRTVLAKIQRDDVQALLEDLHARMAPTAVTARAILSAVFYRALEEDRIAANPMPTRAPKKKRDADGVAVEKPRAVEIKVWPTAGQLDAMARRLGAPSLAMWLMYGCGLRVAESLAVRGDDLIRTPADSEYAGGLVLRVQRQRGEDGRRDDHPLKHRAWGDFREVPVPGYVEALLPAGVTGSLFPPLRPGSFGDQFTRHAAAVGLKGYTPHTMRHLFASGLIHDGAPLFEVSRFMGHTSTDFTAARYGHLAPPALSSGRALLDAAYMRLREAEVAEDDAA